MKTAVIISGGSLDPDFALAFLREEKPELLIGADRGICFLKEKEIHPTHIVGILIPLPEKHWNTLNSFRRSRSVPLIR